MAATQDDLARLDEAQAAEQRKLSEAAALLVLAYWLQVDETDLAGTGATWLSKAIGAIAASYRRSAGVSLAYAQVTRRLALPEEPRLQVPIVTPDLEVIRKSLTYVGLAATAMEQARPLEDTKTLERDTQAALDLLERVERQLGDRAKPSSDTKKRAAVRIAGAALRHTTNGGREQVDALVRADAKALGYVRITQADCCYFCAMLASRGPVYRDDSFARSDPRFEGPGTHKVHDHCRCSMRPVYSRSMMEWPEASLRFSEQWLAATKGGDPKMDRLLFRRAYEGRTQAS